MRSRGRTINSPRFVNGAATMSAVHSPPIGRASLPDPRPVLRCPVHLVTGPDVERRIERVEIRQRPVDSQMRRRMWIGLHLLAQRVVPPEIPPVLRVREEESLIRREALLHLR